MSWTKQFMLHEFIPGFPISPSFPRRRESSKKNNPRSGQSPEVDLLRRCFSMSWMPACAGMTAFFSNGKSRFNFACLVVMTLMLAGCGGSSGGSSTPPAKLTSFIVTTTTVSIAVNTTANLIANGTYSDGKTADITTKVTWTSAASGVAAVGVNSGLVTAGGAEGTTTITASLSGFAAQTVKVTVTSLGGIAISTNTLTDARYDHTASLLGTGKVLVVGGYGSGGALGTTGLYDPSATVNPWTADATLHFPRGDHTSVNLYDGRVLVTGGTDSTYTLLPSTELYDPLATTPAWSLTGNLNNARAYNVIVLLNDHRVLVAGGDTTTGTTYTAEVFDPALVTNGVTGTWTPISPMTVARNSATATLLPNHQVLVAGGYDANAVLLTSCELYDPASGNWTLTGSLHNGRFSHTATLLNSGKVLVVGGGTDTVNLASAEIYDPSTGTWTQTGSLAVARYIHTATLLTVGPDTGKVLVVGGLDDTGNPLTSTELFDPAAVTNGITGSWTTTSSLVEARDNFTSTLIPIIDSLHPNGRVLSVGGDGLTHILNSSELYW